MICRKQSHGVHFLIVNSGYDGLMGSSSDRERQPLVDKSGSLAEGSSNKSAHARPWKKCGFNAFSL